MSYFAQVENTDNPDLQVVVEVIAADQDFISTGAVGDPAYWIQTSYNTRGGVHYGPDGQPDGGVALRANYAGIGYTYNIPNDVFYAPQPYPSWTIGPTDWIWQPPVPYPTDGGIYTWNEATQSWDPAPQSSQDPKPVAP
jgi:hypothetical protein